jgi:hypothetical protein
MISGTIVLGNRAIIKDEWFKNDVDLNYDEFGMIIGCKFEGNVKIHAPSTPYKDPDNPDRQFILNYIGGNLEIEGRVKNEFNFINSAKSWHDFGLDIKFKTEK